MTAPVQQLGLLPSTWPTIVCDHPWQYDDDGGASDSKAFRGAVAREYKTMSLAEIVAMPVHRLAWPNAHLYLWTTNAFLEPAFKVMRAYGFDYKTTITWDKENFGLGRYFRNQTEHVLFGVRGRAPLLVHNLPTIFRAPRGEHSEKPDEFFRIVDKASPGPKVSLFDRKARGEDWAIWGDEAPDGIHIPALVRRAA